MIDLLGKYFSGNVTLEEKTEVEAWRNESDANAAEFFEYSTLWNEVSGEVKLDKASALSSVMSRIDISEEDSDKVVPMTHEFSMIDLLGKYFSGNVTLEEKTQVEAWRNESDANAAEFFEYSTLWNEVSGEVKLDKASALSSVMSRIDTSGEDSGKVVPMTQKDVGGWRQLLKYAAILVIGATVALYVSNQQGISGSDGSALISVVTENGQKQEVTLPDGSKVFLSESSSLTYSDTFTGATREVSLEGKAFFEIQRNEQMPFVVRTEESEVTVLGTSFLVNTMAENKNTEVVVETGKVAVSKNTKKYKGNASRVELVPGEMVTVSKNSTSIAKNKNVNQNYLSWKTSVIDFNRSNLGEVLKTLEEVYNIKLNVSDEELYNCKLSAKFDHRSVGSVLEIISQTFDLEVEKVSKREFNLIGAGCALVQ